MTVVEFSMLVVAVAVATSAVCIVVATVRLVPLLRSAGDLASDARRTLQRFDRIATDLEQIGHDARQIERRVAHTVERVLDQVEPPLHTVSALLAGARAGIGALFRLAYREPSGNSGADPTQVDDSPIATGRTAERSTT